MINPEVGVPLVAGIAAVAVLIRQSFRHRERMAEIASNASRPSVDSERMARLEQAVEAIAIETERVGEGQRYLTRLLDDRNGQKADRPLRSGAVNTPH